MPNELKLLPCPFCGGNAFISARLPYFGKVLTVAVVCEECNASSKHKRTDEEAVAAWNRRANDEKQHPQESDL